MKNIILLCAFLISGTIFCQNKVAHQKQDIQKVISKSDTEVKNVKVDILDKGIVTSSKVYQMSSVQIPQNREFNVKYDVKPEELKGDEVPNTLKNNEALGTGQLPNNYLRIPEIMYSKVKNSDEIISYQIYLVSKSSFKYNHKDELFLGDVDFVLIDIKDESSTKELEQPVHIEIDQGNVDQIQPKSFSLSKLNLPPSKIKLSEENGLDSLQIRILTASNLAGYPVSLKVEPALRISTLAKNVHAFGMGKIKMNINTIGSSSLDSIQVSLDTDNGKITPEKITLKNNELKTVQLQSGNKLGKVKIKATGRGANSFAYKSNLIVINYVFPWIFVFLLIAGGAVGSLARHQKKINITKLFFGMIDGFIAGIFYFFLKIPIPKLGELDYIGVVIFGIGILGGLATITSLFPFVKTLIFPSPAADVE